jgi:hypothetical protein
MKELDRREGVTQPQPATDQLAQLPHRAAFEARMAAFAESFRKRQAEVAERAARTNGVSPDQMAEATAKAG